MKLTFNLRMLRFLDLFSFRFKLLGYLVFYFYLIVENRYLLLPVDGMSVNATKHAHCQEYLSFHFIPSSSKALCVASCSFFMCSNCALKSVSAIGVVVVGVVVVGVVVGGVPEALVEEGEGVIGVEALRLVASLAERLLVALLSFVRFLFLEWEEVGMGEGGARLSAVFDRCFRRISTFKLTSKLSSYPSNRVSKLVSYGILKQRIKISLETVFFRDTLRHRSKSTTESESNNPRSMSNCSLSLKRASSL